MKGAFGVGIFEPITIENFVMPQHDFLSHFGIPNAGKLRKNFVSLQGQFDKFPEM